MAGQGSAMRSHSGPFPPACATAGSNAATASAQKKCLMFIVVESFPTKLTKIPTTANSRPAQKSPTSTSQPYHKKPLLNKSLFINNY